MDLNIFFLQSVRTAQHHFLLSFFKVKLYCVNYIVSQTSDCIPFLYVPFMGSRLSVDLNSACHRNVIFLHVSFDYMLALRRCRLPKQLSRSVERQPVQPKVNFSYFVCAFSLKNRREQLTVLTSDHQPVQTIIHVSSFNYENCPKQLVFV